MNEEMRCKYIDFLESKGCVKEGLNDIHFIKDGEMVTEQIMSKKIKSTPELYVEFCKMNDLEVQELFVFGNSLDVEAIYSAYCGTRAAKMGK